MAYIGTDYFLFGTDIIPTNTSKLNVCRFIKSSIRRTLLRRTISNGPNTMLFTKQYNLKLFLTRHQTTFELIPIPQFEQSHSQCNNTAQPVGHNTKRHSFISDFHQHLLIFRSLLTTNRINKRVASVQKTKF
jgi:hypothetical protein